MSTFSLVIKLAVASFLFAPNLGFQYTSAPDDVLLNQLRSSVQALIIANAGPAPPGPSPPGTTGPLVILPTLVRLGFHDCVGGCDGCINLQNPENNGLAGVITHLETLYNDPQTSYSTKFSRADFWALSATLAAEMGAGKQMAPPGGGQIYTPTFQFKWGRQDCATSPSIAANLHFPTPFGNTSQTTGFFATAMGLTANETVALLGAHTLGDASPQASGFVGPWVPRIDVLDNQYFVDLIGLTWNQAVVAQNGGKKQWTRTGGNGGPNFLMLNADMALHKDIGSPAADGTVACTYATCAASSTTAKVAEYAANNVLWLDDFALVWDKMLAAGNANLYTISSSVTLPPTCPASLCMAANPTRAPSASPSSTPSTSAPLGMGLTHPPSTTSPTTNSPTTGTPSTAGPTRSPLPKAMKPAPPSNSPSNTPSNVPSRSPLTKGRTHPPVVQPTASPVAPPASTCGCPSTLPSNTTCADFVCRYRSGTRANPSIAQTACGNSADPQTACLCPSMVNNVAVNQVPCLCCGITSMNDCLQQTCDTTDAASNAVTARCVWGAAGTSPRCNCPNNDCALRTATNPVGTFVSLTLLASVTVPITCTSVPASFCMNPFTTSFQTSQLGGVSGDFLLETSGCNVTGTTGTFTAALSFESAAQVGAIKAELADLSPFVAAMLAQYGVTLSACTADVANLVCLDLTASKVCGSLVTNAAPGLRVVDGFLVAVVGLVILLVQ